MYIVLHGNAYNLNLCLPLHFVAPSCTPHGGMNLIFANLAKGIFGESGINYRNAMQLLHSLYTLVGPNKHHKLQLMWESLNGQAPRNKISKAVLARRWRWVNVAAQHLKEQQLGSVASTHPRSLEQCTTGGTAAHGKLRLLI